MHSKAGKATTSAAQFDVELARKALRGRDEVYSKNEQAGIWLDNFLVSLEKDPFPKGYKRIAHIYQLKIRPPAQNFFVTIEWLVRDSYKKVVVSNIDIS